MPKKFDSCVAKIRKQGKSKSSSYAICTSSLGKSKTKRKK